MTALATMHEAFNARGLAPRVVADGFVIPRHFDLLQAPGHALILGARGSGKTTLLKMLLPSALAAWDSTRLRRARPRIPYLASWIPADRLWRAEGTVSRGAARQVAAAQTVRALVDTLLEASGPPIDGVPHVSFTESALATALAAELGLDLQGATTLRSVRTSAGRVIRRLQSDPEAPVMSASLEHPLAAASAALDAIEEHTGYRGAWALLFDELELASELAEELVSAMRGGDPRLYIKVATGMYRPESASDHSPTPDNDYKEILLSFGRQTDSDNFVERLWQDLLDRSPRRSRPATLHEWLGSSLLSPVSDSPTYGPDSPMAQIYAELSASDSTFREALEQRGIEPHSLNALPDSLMDSFVRKTRQQVVIRHAYRPQDTRGTVRVKTLGPYAGSALVRVTDGNPRWIRALFAELDTTSSAKPSRSMQARILDVAINNYRSFLATLDADWRLASGSDSEHRVGLLPFIDRIGGSLRLRVLDGPFDPEAQECFRVDDDAPTEIVKVLGRAMDAGAIVYAPTRGFAQPLWGGQLRGKRFRLSYRLAPYYRLPIRLGREGRLSSLLEGPSGQGQGSLGV